MPNHVPVEGQELFARPFFAHSSQARKTTLPNVLVHGGHADVVPAPVMSKRVFHGKEDIPG
jgi:hypothetical protein